jgi:LysR family transcriptional regulator, low CO2-responsive transcriptional regulator
MLYVLRRYCKHGTFSQLRVFEAAARLGSFTLAAEELCIAQPTVSVQIRKLTDTIGVQLFINKGRCVCLTEAGRCLFELCQAIFNKIIEFDQVVHEMEEDEVAYLR